MPTLPPRATLTAFEASRLFVGISKLMASISAWTPFVASSDSVKEKRIVLHQTVSIYNRLPPGSGRAGRPGCENEGDRSTDGRNPRDIGQGLLGICRHFEGVPHLCGDRWLSPCLIAKALTSECVHLTPGASALNNCVKETWSLQGAGISLERSR